MIQEYKIIRSLLHTEKGTALAPINKYVFEVDRRANKSEIKKAVEEIYKVKVKKVNTMIMPGKLRRVRYVAGKTADWKKAVVTLQQGQKIDIAT
ncbi:MAG: 50S ribosomal protein L23 [Omnitrophica WOR_2 bacterium SM23_29]|nr:MAG: 50S ribosomal protein L23 [Omnitrophica WOR_2 bacterium SM23_29]